MNNVDSIVDKYIYPVYWCQEVQYLLQNCFLEEGFSGEESGAALNLDSWILLSVPGTSAREEQMFIHYNLCYKQNKTSRQSITKQQLQSIKRFNFVRRCSWRCAYDVRAPRERVGTLLKAHLLPQVFRVCFLLSHCLLHWRPPASVWQKWPFSFYLWADKQSVSVKCCVHSPWSRTRLIIYFINETRNKLFYL